MKFIKSKKAIVLLVTLVVAVAASIGAYAYFTTSGSGTGSGSVGTAGSWTVAPGTATGSAFLYPGSGSQSIAGTVTNNSHANQFLAQVTATIAAPDTTGSPTGDLAHPCSASDFTLDASTGWVVAGDGQSATYAIGSDLAGDAPGPAASAPWTALAFHMVNQAYNQNNCHSSVPKITFDAS
jgi:hypothetical protein